VDQAESSVARGEGRRITTPEEASQLADEIKRRGPRPAGIRTESPLMGGFRLSPEAEADLDDIWLYVARESGSIDAANRLIDSLTVRFVLLARHPHIGRQRDADLRPGLRSFSVG
jgi:plasmid stabilization system protein ParE